MTSPSPVSCDLHELTSSPTSSEDDQPQGIDEDILRRPSTYRLPCDTVSGTPSPSPAACPAVNGMLSSSEDDAVDEILSPSEDD